MAPGRRKKPLPPIKLERVVVGRQRRLVIPARMLDAIGAKVGEELLASVEDGRLVMEAWEEFERRLWMACAAVAPKARCMSKELLRERRREARREAQE